MSRSYVQLHAIHRLVVVKTPLTGYDGRMASNWSKGFTKDTHPSVKKISDTMRRRGVNNFLGWREKMIAEGKIKTVYPRFKQNGDLAELIGVMLGDGNIEKFPRTERLLIFSNSNNRGFIKRYGAIVGRMFNKRPYIYLQSKQNCVRISLYEKSISSRMGIPCGSRKKLKIIVPKWILAKREHIVRYLRGLYEAEGSVSFHIPTCTHKFVFSNLNESLLNVVYQLMVQLGFHPSIGKGRVQISRRAEVARAVELLQFRKY